MKRVSVIVLVLPALLTLGSCLREQFAEVGEGSFIATFDENLKTSLNGNNVLWTEGDCINVFSADVNRRYTLVSGAGTPSGGFSGDNISGDQYFALYPYDENASLKDGRIVTTFPSQQYAVDNGIGNGSNLSVACAEGRTLQFRNVGGLVRFQITTENVGEVIIEGNDNEVLAGTVSIGWNDGEPDFLMGEDGCTRVSVKPTDGPVFAPGVYHAIVLPRNFSKGITITLKPAAQPLKNVVLAQVLPDDMVKSGASALNLRRSHVVVVDDMDGGRLWNYTGVQMNCIRGKANDVGSYIDLRTGRTFNPVNNPGQCGADIQMCFVQSNVRALGVVSLSGGNAVSFVNETNLRKFDTSYWAYQSRDLTQNWPARGTSNFRWLTASEMDGEKYNALTSTADIMHLVNGNMLTSTVKDLGSPGKTTDLTQMTPEELEGGVKKYLLFTVKTGGTDDYFGVMKFTSYSNDANYPRVYFDYKIGRGPNASPVTPVPDVPEYGNDDVPVNEVVGCTTTGSQYALTDEPILIEGARAIQEMGSKCIKVWFEHAGKQYLYNSDWPDNVENMSSLQLAQTPYYRQLFDMPFKTYSLEFNDATVNWKDGLSAAEKTKVFNNLYGLATHLLKTYRGTGKTFIIQNWEGDGHLNRSSLSDDKLPAAIQGMIDWANTRQDAVTRARRDVGCDGVLVVNAFEFNYVLITNMPEPFVIDVVVPYTHCDLYSYSSYSSGRSKDVLDDIYKRVDYIRSKTPGSSIYGNHNLMIGEFGYDERRVPGKGYKPLTPEMDQYQFDMIKGQLDRLLDLKVTYVFLWQMYCNGLVDDNGVTIATAPPDPDKMADNGHCKGFWLIRADGTKTKTYTYLKDDLFRNNPSVKAKYPVY